MIFLSFSSCENNVAIGDQSPIVFPTDQAVSFQLHIKPFVQQKCAYSGCHNDYTIAGGRRFTDYYTYFETSNLGFVIAGSPDASLFLQVMNGKNPHLLNYRIVWTQKWRILSNYFLRLKKPIKRQ